MEGGKWSTLLLHEYVFLETVTVLAARRDAKTARAFGEALLAAKEVELVPGFDSFHDTWDAFREEAPGALSFAGAALVRLARARDAEAIATFDEGFRRVRGVRVVPR